MHLTPTHRSEQRSGRGERIRAANILGSINTDRHGGRQAWRKTDSYETKIGLHSPVQSGITKKKGSIQEGALEIVNGIVLWLQKG